MASSRLSCVAIVAASCIAAFLYFDVQSGALFGTSAIMQTTSNGPAGVTAYADKFTPDVLLSAPRRSSAVPDPSGKYAVYTVSTYSFDSHDKTLEIRVIDLASGQSTLVTNDRSASEPNWLGDATGLLWLKEGEKGATELVIGSIDKIGESYVAGTLSGRISNVKLESLGPGK